MHGPREESTVRERQPFGGVATFPTWKRTVESIRKINFWNLSLEGPEKAIAFAARAARARVSGLIGCAADDFPTLVISPQTNRLPRNSATRTNAGGAEFDTSDGAR